MKNVDLHKYSNKNFERGNIFKRFIWYAVNNLVFKCFIPWPQVFKLSLLKCFGARIGKDVVIKPEASIKYPWFLDIGNNVWIGENAWIDNLTRVAIGNNVCISQGAYIATGNHDYKKEAFDLIIKPVVIEDGVWVGAKAVICPGVTLKTHSVITAGSVATGDAEPYTIYQGNPAAAIRKRTIE